MNSNQQNNNGQTTQVSKVNNSSISGFLNKMKKGLKAAGAAQAFPYDKEAMLRSVSEDK